MQIFNNLLQHQYIPEEEENTIPNPETPTVSTPNTKLTKTKKNGFPSIQPPRNSNKINNRCKSHTNNNNQNIDTLNL